MPDRCGQTGGRFGLEPTARLARVRVNGLDREVQELSLSGSSDQDLQAATKTAARRVIDARQVPSPPSSRPPHPASAGRRR